MRLARGGVGDLVVELGGTPQPGRLRDALARALGDPSLELGYAIGDDGGYVDSAARTVDTSPGRDARSRSSSAGESRSPRWFTIPRWPSTPGS